jgi:hypothetical protein
MERTDRLTKLVSLLLFIAMLAYIGFYILRSFSDQVQTAPAIKVTIQESSQASGIIIRDELVVESDMAYINVTAEEGKMIAAGDPVAVSYTSEEALSRANRIREIELEIERISTLLSGLASAEDLSTHDTAVKAALLDLSASIERHDLTELDSNSLKLSSLVFEGGNETVSEADLEALEFELSGLKASSVYDTVEIPAEKPGLFSAILDVTNISGPRYKFHQTGGYQSPPIRPPGRIFNAIGKLICSYTWYFAAVMDEASAKSLYKGCSAHLDFGRFIIFRFPPKS